MGNLARISYAYVSFARPPARTQYRPWRRAAEPPDRGGRGATVLECVEQKIYDRAAAAEQTSQVPPHDLPRIQPKIEQSDPSLSRPGRVSHATSPYPLRVDCIWPQNCSTGRLSPANSCFFLRATRPLVCLCTLARAGAKKSWHSLQHISQTDATTKQHRSLPHITQCRKGRAKYAWHWAC
jgi:hypothetical protein